MAGEKYREENGQFEFDFTNAIWSMNNLNEIFHKSGISILSDVDFIAETEKEIIFLEYKNANIRNAVNPDSFKPSEEKSINKIAYKFYDSFLYTKSQGYEKPYKYIYILEYPKGDSVTRKIIREKIYKKLPFKMYENGYIQNKMLEKFEVLSIEEWNSNYSKLPIYSLL